MNRYRLRFFSAVIVVAVLGAWIIPPHPGGGVELFDELVVDGEGTIDFDLSTPPNSAKCHLRVIWQNGPNGTKKLVGTPTCSGLPACQQPSTCVLWSMPRPNGATIYGCNCQ